MQPEDRKSSSQTASPPSSGRGILWFLLIPTLLVVFGALTLFLRSRSNRVLAATTQSMEAEPVTVTHPQPGKPDNDLALPSSLQAFSQSPIYARASGYIAHWYTDIGTHVHRGQLLAVIEAPELDQQLAQARATFSQNQANLALAQVTARRFQDLIRTHAVAQQQLDQANQAFSAQSATTAAAAATVKQLEEMQSYERVVAPFDGIITQRLTDIGDLINAGNGGANSQLFSISQLSTIRTFVPVPEMYSAQIANGLHATLDLVQLPHQVFTGTVTRSSHAIDPVSHTLLTEIDVPNPTGKLLPGAYATVHLHLAAQTPPLTVPIGAVLFQAAGPQVAIVNAGKQIDLRKVTLGRDFGNTIEVTGGLNAQDAIVASPPDYLVQGMHVTVQPPAGQQADASAKGSKS